jgi:hypothetical protein
MPLIPEPPANNQNHHLSMRTNAADQSSARAAETVNPSTATPQSHGQSRMSVTPTISNPPTRMQSTSVAIDDASSASSSTSPVAATLIAGPSYTQTLREQQNRIREEKARLMRL